MRTGVYYKATGGCMGLIQNFSVIPDPPAHATQRASRRFTLSALENWAAGFWAGAGAVSLM